MSLKRILVQVNIDAFPAARVRLAAALAARFGADLVGFAAAGPAPYLPADDGYIDPRLLERRREEIRAALSRCEGEFRAAAGEAGVLEWRAHVRPPTEVLAREARTADLVITGSGGDTDDYYRFVDVAELLLRAGRPVLVAAEGAAALPGARVLVAWKDCREARRAVHDALPLLAGAEDVLVAAVDEDGDGAVRHGAEETAQFLVRHGIKARAEVIAAAASTAEHIEAAARGMGADLVVSGAYGHSRLREWVFGGVTRSLLQNGTMHRLMSN